MLKRLDILATSYIVGYLISHGYAASTTDAKRLLDALVATPSKALRVLRRA